MSENEALEREVRAAWKEYTAVRDEITRASARR